ncbi:MAG: 4'-phosphopantetheinyl transferase superfamily protein [Rhodothermales bacterium]|nr:4'-phosphopantetheinyl transferase superfamily protein [Rhodothermales bacterium]
MGITDDVIEWRGGIMPAFPADGDVHLWRASLDPGQIAISRFQSVLQDDELERAARFRFDVHRNRYIASRGILRILLSGYLDLEAREIAIVLTSHGKPELQRGQSDLRFNLSHAGDMGVFAFAAGRRVGVDVEETARDVSFRQLASRYFSPDEQAVLANSSDADIRNVFYACWTRKEAYIKALGLGVTHGLDNFTVAIAPDAKPAIIQSKVDADAPERWGMRAFVPADGFAGALVAEGKDWSLRHFQFSPAG